MDAPAKWGGYKERKRESERLPCSHGSLLPCLCLVGAKRRRVSNGIGKSSLGWTKGARGYRNSRMKTGQLLLAAKKAINQ